MRKNAEEFRPPEITENQIYCPEHKQVITRVRITKINDKINGSYSICEQCQGSTESVLFDDALNEYKKKQKRDIARFEQLFQQTKNIIEKLQNMKNTNFLAQQQIQQLQNFINSLKQQLDKYIKDNFLEESEISFTQLEKFAPYLSMSESKQQILDIEQWNNLKKLKNQFEEHYKKEYKKCFSNIYQFQQNQKLLILELQQIDMEYLKQNEEIDQTYYKDLSLCQHQEGTLYINIGKHVKNRVKCELCSGGQDCVQLIQTLKNHQNALSIASKKYNLKDIQLFLEQVSKNFQINQDYLQQFQESIHKGLNSWKKFIEELRLENDKINKDYTKKELFQQFAQENYKIYEQIYNDPKQKIDSDQLVELMERHLDKVQIKFNAAFHEIYFSTMNNIRSIMEQINNNFKQMEQRINNYDTKRQLSQSIALQVSLQDFTNNPHNGQIFFDHYDKHFLLLLNFNLITLYSREESKQVFYKSTDQSQVKEDIVTACLETDLKWLALSTINHITFGQIQNQQSKDMLKLIKLSQSFSVQRIVQIVPDSFRNYCYSRNDKQIQIWKCYQNMKWQHINNINSEIHCFTYSLNKEQAQLWLFQNSQNGDRIQIKFYVQFVNTTLEVKGINNSQIQNVDQIQINQKNQFEFHLQQPQPIKSAYYLETTRNLYVQKFIIVLENSVILIELDIKKQSVIILKRLKVAPDNLVIDQQRNYFIQYSKETILIYKLDEDKQIINKFKLKPYAQMLQQQSVVSCSISQKFLTVFFDNQFIVQYKFLYNQRLCENPNQSTKCAPCFFKYRESLIKS